MGGASLLDVTSRQRLPVRRRASGDHIAVGLLILLPLLAFTIAAVTGHTIMPRDDVDQNFPLRVLVGQQLRHGQLPLLNPYIWSGAPLLAGWNAGAAYPFTGLFAILPATAAWVANEVIAYVTAGLGLYAFLRGRQIRPVGAWLGAMTFVAGGSFAIQVEHFGLVAGVSWIPWAMVALDRLARGAASRRAAVGWISLLGVSGAMCVLAGEPRAIDDAGVVLGAYGLWLLVRGGSRRWRFVAAVAAGLVLAAAISAVQWLPGLHAVANSQRSDATYQLFSSGSLKPPWLALLTVPVLLGGSGSFHLPGFFSSYNLPELSSYVGLLPLAAAVGLLGRLRFRRPVPEWLIWHVLVVVGLLFALGGHTPLGPLLYHVPLFGDQRLQSRNVMIADLALAVLFAYWVEHWLTDRRAYRPAHLAAVPAVVAAAFSVLGLVSPATLAPLLGVPRAASQVRQMWPAYVAYLALAVAVVVYLYCGRWLRGRLRPGLLVAIMGADLLLSAGAVIVHVEPRPHGPHDAVVNAAGSFAHTVPLRVPLASIGRDARFLVYGPDGIASYDMGGVGITDLNAMRGRYSMQGYSAIVDGHYAAATGTHKAMGQGHNTVSLRVVGDGTLDQLATGYLMTLPRYLLSDPATTPSSPVTRTVRSGAPSSWYFGQALDVTKVSVPVPTGRARVGLLLANGHTRWLSGPLHGAVRAVGVVVSAVGGTARVTTPTVAVGGGQSFIADGALQQALSAHGWQFAGDLAEYSVFTNPTPDPVLSVAALPGRQLSDASVKRLSGDPLLPTSARVTSRSGALVVRSVAAIPGWSASWQPSDGSARRSLPVVRHGLVQAVAVPAGTGVVRWHYDPPGFTVGAWSAVVGLAGLIIAMTYVTWGGWRWRGLRGRAVPEQGGQNGCG